MRVLILRDDITTVEADAIVNPANSLGVMGGGVSGAIKRKGGDEIEEEVLEKAPIEIGEAVATKAGRLPSRWVIHAPTVNAPAEKSDEGKIAAAVLAALECAEELGCKSIALPGMGTGVGGVSYRRAAVAMRSAIREFFRKRRDLKTIILVAYNPSLEEAFVRVFKL